MWTRARATCLAASTAVPATVEAPAQAGTTREDEVADGLPSTFAGLQAAVDRLPAALSNNAVRDEDPSCEGERRGCEYSTELASRLRELAAD